MSTAMHILGYGLLLGSIAVCAVGAWRILSTCFKRGPR